MEIEVGTYLLANDTVTFRHGYEPFHLKKGNIYLVVEISIDTDIAGYDNLFFHIIDDYGTKGKFHMDGLYNEGYELEICPVHLLRIKKLEQIFG